MEKGSISIPQQSNKKIYINGCCVLYRIKHSERDRNKHKPFIILNFAEKHTPNVDSKVSVEKERNINYEA